MLHSGSRNIGKELAEIHIAKAKKLAHNRDLPDRDLAVFLAGTAEMAAYRRDLFWAQRYARAEPRGDDRRSRSSVLRGHFPRARLTRRADLVPPQLRRRGGPLRRGGAGDAQGRDPRGPGRAWASSRARWARARTSSAGSGNRRVVRERLARRRPEDEPRRGEAALLGEAISRSRPRASSAARTAASIDEIPGAYKRIEEVMEDQQDLVEIVTELKPGALRQGVTSPAVRRPPNPVRRGPGVVERLSGLLRRPADLVRRGPDRSNKRPEPCPTSVWSRRTRLEARRTYLEGRRRSSNASSNGVGPLTRGCSGPTIAARCDAPRSSPHSSRPRARRVSSSTASAIFTRRGARRRTAEMAAQEARGRARAPEPARREARATAAGPARRARWRRRRASTASST